MSTIHDWFRKNATFAVLLSVGTAAATFAVIKVTVISGLQRERDDAKARAQRLEGEKSALATESGKLEAKIEALDKEAGSGDASIGALRVAITRLEGQQNDLWKSVTEVQKKLQISPKKVAPPKRVFIRTQVDSTIDRCSKAVVTVFGTDGPVTIERGETGEIPLPPSGEIFWTCGSVRERTRTASGANIAILSRDRGGRAMTWLFYTQVERKRNGE